MVHHRFEVSQRAFKPQDITFGDTLAIVTVDTFGAYLDIVIYTRRLLKKVQEPFQGYRLTQVKGVEYE